MEGTWGRRVYGRVIKGESATVFILSMDLGGLSIKRVREVHHNVLDAFPEAYGLTLDYLTESIDREIAKHL